MSDYGLFWNSRGGDRIYNADSMEEFIKPFFSTGTFGGDLMVTATTGMTVSVAAGYCNINGKVMRFSEAKTFTLAVASPSANRVDTIVVERNDGDRTFTMKAITGTDGGSATAPVRTGGVYQIVLAQIAVAAGATAITQSNITDTRSDTTLCGIVTATTFDELAAEFNSWFDNFRSNISGDAAAHLQIEIENLQAEIDIKRRVTTKILSAANWSNGTYDLTSDFPDNEYDIEIAPYGSMSESQLSEYNNAALIGSNTTNVIEALGTVPSADIPVMVVYFTKG